MRAIWAAVVMLGLAVPAQAQPLVQGEEQHAILVVDLEQLFEKSLFGQRIAADYAQARVDLAAENRVIESALEEEAKSLAEARDRMDPAVFRGEAEAFDKKVQDIRVAQDAKEAALEQIRTQGSTQFFGAIQPYLATMMDRHGADIMLSSRVVILNRRASDVTAQALALVDRELGDGRAPEETPPPQDGAPAPGEAPADGDN